MSILDKISKDGEVSRENGAAAPATSIDAYVDIINQALISPSFLEQARNTVAAMRAINGLPAITPPITFEHAYEQISGDHRGSLLLSHDLDGEESFFIMVPPGWWWFGNNITPEIYDGMMERAIHEAKARART